MKDKILPPSKFPTILGFSALLVALCAAFFSVYGISTLFAGASISAMVMASSLEIGKFVGTTFLYRYWSKCQGFLKAYLIGAILVLMLITSLGIFGYLSSAYQQSSIAYGVTQDKIVSLQEQKTFYTDKITTDKKRIDDYTVLRNSQDSRMTQVLTNEYISRNPIQLRQLQQQNEDLINQTDSNIKDVNTDIQSSSDDIHKLDDQINELKLGTSTKKDVQTFKFVADALHLSLDQVARWFILFIIFVFDPLAMCLVLAYNVAVVNKHEEDKIIVNTTILPPSTPKVEPTPIVVPPTPIPTPIVSPTVETTSETTNKKTEAKNSDMSSFFRQMFKV